MAIISSIPDIPDIVDQENISPSILDGIDDNYLVNTDQSNVIETNIVATESKENDSSNEEVKNRLQEVMYGPDYEKEFKKIGEDFLALDFESKGNPNIDIPDFGGDVPPLKTDKTKSAMKSDLDIPDVDAPPDPKNDYWGRVYYDLKQMSGGTWDVVKGGVTALYGYLRYGGDKLLNKIPDTGDAKEEVKIMHEYMDRFMSKPDTKGGKRMFEIIGYGIKALDDAVDKHVYKPNIEAGTKGLGDLGLLSYEHLKVLIGFGGARIAGLRGRNIRLQKDLLEKQLEFKQTRPLSELAKAEETIKQRKELTDLGTKELEKLADDGLRVEPWELTSKQITDLVKPKDLKEAIRVAHESIVENALKMREPVPQKVIDSVPNVKSRFGQSGEFDAGLLFDLGAGISRTIKNTAKGTKEVVDFLARPLFYSQTGGIRMLNTKTARALADRVSANPLARKIIGPDYFQRVSRRTGHYHSQLQKTLEPYTNRIGRLSKDLNKQVVRALRDNKLHVSETARRIANEIRPLLIKIRQDQLKAGLEVGEVANYFPRSWKQSKIRRNPEGFKKFLISQGYKPDQAGRIINSILNEEQSYGVKFIKGERVSKDSDVYTNQRSSGGGPIKTSPEKSRVLDVNELMAEPWLENNAMAVLSRYMESASKRIEYANTFGPKEGILNNMVRQIIKEADAVGRGGSHFQKSVVDRVYKLADQMQGSYNTFPNHLPGRIMNKLNSMTAGGHVMIHLGLVALASIPELVTTIARTGFSPKAYLEGINYANRAALRSASKLITGKYKFKKSEAAELLEDLGVIAKAGFETSIAERFAGKTGTVTNAFIKATGLETLTNMQRVIALKSFQKMIQNHIKDISKNRLTKNSKSKAQELKNLGINPDDVAIIEWAKSGAELSTMPEIVKMGMIRGVNQVITKPNPGTTPAWMNNPYLKNVALFQRFNTSFSNVFLNKALHDLAGKSLPRRKAEVLATLTTMVTLAYFAQMLREYIKGNLDDYDDVSKKQRVADAFDRAALTGHFTRGYQLFVNPYKYGYRDNISSRFMSMFGPATGNATRMYDAVTDKFAPGEKTAKMISKLIPIMNIRGEDKEKMSERIEALMDRWGFSDWLEDFNDSDDL